MRLRGIASSKDWRFCFSFNATGTYMLLIALTACGGGGGGGSSSGGTTPPVVTPPAPDQGNLLTTLPTATYAAGSREAEFFAEINAARGTEFGYLVQSAELDKGAAAHALYLQSAIIEPQLDPDGNQYTLPDGTKIFQNANPNYGIPDPATGWLGAHVETAGKLNFTGVLPKDRANAKGYAGGVAGSVGEVIADELPTGVYKSPCVYTLLNSVFHRGAILDTNNVDVGIGLSYLHSFTTRACVINFSYDRSKAANRVADDWVGVFPRNNSTEVATQMWGNEAPDPVPEFSVKGNPVSLFIKSGHALVVSAFTLSGPTGTVPVKLLTTTTFPNYISGHQAYIVPNGALAAGAKYTVTFTGTDNGKAVGCNGSTTSCTWSFTTTSTGRL